MVTLCMSLFLLFESTTLLCSQTFYFFHLHFLFMVIEIDTNRDFSREFFDYMKEGPGELRGKLNVETVPKSMFEGQDCMQCDEIELWVIRLRDDEDG